MITHDAANKKFDFHGDHALVSLYVQLVALNDSCNTAEARNAVLMIAPGTLQFKLIRQLIDDAGANISDQLKDLATSHAYQKETTEGE